MDSSSPARVDLAIDVVCGLPGIPVEGEVMPEPTDDFASELKALGATVRFAVPDAERVGFRGPEIWLPILSFASDVAANASGDLVATALMSLLRRRRSEGSTVRIRLEHRSPDREVILEMDGPAAQVVEALRVLGQPGKD